MKPFSLPRIFALCAALAVFTATALAEHSAIVPAPRGDDWWKTRANLLNQRVKDMPDAQLLFIGDSITQGWEGEGKAAWEKYYAPRKTVNIGIGGDRTQHVLWRLQNGNLEGIKPKAAVVMIGTNNSNGDDNTPGQIAEGVAAIVKTLREKQPQMKILLLAIFPRGENFNNQRGKITQINQVLHKLHDGEHVFFKDIGHRFLDSDGILPAAIMPDYLHLSPKGYDIWASAIEDNLVKMLGGDAAKSASADPSGEWIWKIRGPDGDVEAPLILKKEGAKITGKFKRDETRWLEIIDGSIDGNEMKWTVKRDRSTGGEMVYKMTGKLDGDKITGQAKTEFDGNPADSEWSARRK